MLHATACLNKAGPQGRSELLLDEVLQPRAASQLKLGLADACKPIQAERMQ